MKFLSFLSSLVILACVLFSCHSNSGGQGGSAADTLKEGEKPVYSENGKLHFIVEKKNGKANGRVREFYPDGKIYMDAIYKDDHRNGKCTFYFKNGKPFSVGYFINGAKDSIETKYTENGQVLALVPYKKDKVQPGLKEFKKDGSELIETTSIQIKTVNQLASGGKYYLKVSLSEPRKDVKYYASPQSNPDSREILKISGNEGILEVPVPPHGLVMRNLLFDAEYKTSMGNTMRLQKRYKLSVER